MNADMKPKYDISSLSSHLFWDTPIEDIDWYTHSGFIIERVMGYGRIEDWEIIKKVYSKEEMREIVKDIRVLDDFSIAFLSVVLDLPKGDFKCYTERQYQPSFWHY